MSKGYDKLLAEVRRVLFEEWDPIGVNHDADMEDEYDNYAPRLTEMLLAREPKDSILNELWEIETVSIGLTGNRSATEYFAGQLIEIAKEVLDPPTP
jgi:hypothetical protein